MKKEKVWDYLFEDQETGEQFFVEVETKEEAERIAKENFEKPEYIDKYTVAQAEWYGLDTY